MTTIIDQIRQELKANSERKMKEGAERYFKEEIKPYGVRTAITRKIGKAHFKTIKNKPKNEIFGLCEELWQSGYLEESFIASDWSYYLKNDYEPKDFEVFEKWIGTYLNNWASCLQLWQSG